MTPVNPSNDNTNTKQDIDISGSAAVPSTAVPAGLSYVASCQGNQDKIDEVGNVVVSGNTIAITVDDGVENLDSYARNVSETSKKWLVLDIATDVSDITDLTYNGTAIDGTDETTWGLAEGHILAWIDAEDPSTITISGDDYNNKVITVTVADGASG